MFPHLRGSRVHCFRDLCNGVTKSPSRAHESIYLYDFKKPHLFREPENPCTVFRHFVTVSHLCGNMETLKQRGNNEPLTT